MQYFGIYRTLEIIDTYMSYGTTLAAVTELKNY